MTTAELLSRLIARGVKLWVEDDRLRVRAPKGVLEPDVLAELNLRKPEIIQFLREAVADAQPAASIPLAPRDQALPLSFAQQRLWFLHQYDPQMIAYNIPAVLLLRGRLELAALHQAIVEIIARHESLRTSFGTLEGQPVQVIAPPRAPALPLIDLQNVPPHRREPVAQAQAQATIRRPFDLQRGPLVRLRILRLTPDTHILTLVLHHSIGDGWSLGVLVRELVAYYRARLTDQPDGLPDLPIQYADYAVWQRRTLQGELLDAQIAYWRDQLAGLATLQLPTDHPRPPTLTFAGRSQSLQLGQPLTDALAALSRQADVTLFITILAVFQVLLTRYSSQDDIVVGTPIAGRTLAETEPLIGFFVNTLVLRADLRGSPTFATLLARVKQVALAAYEHQELPFERLVEALAPERDPSRNPLFQVMFALQNTPDESFALPGLAVEPLPIETGVAQFDLNLALAPTPNGLSGALSYRTDLFEAATIARMCDHFMNLLAGAAAHPERCLADLPLLTAAEQHQLLSWNATYADDPPGGALPELCAAQAARTPDAVALVYGPAHLSYGALDRRATQFARHLRTRGVVPGSRVGICLPRSLDLIIGVLGALKAGSAYVPLDPAYPPARLARMLADSGATLLITAANGGRTTTDDPSPIGGRLSAVPTLDLARDWPLIERASAAPLNDPPRPDALLYLIATSGSTGVPKSAGVTQRGFRNLLRWFIDSFVITTDDRVLIVSSFSFDLTQKDLFAPLLTGGQLHLFDAAHHDPALLRRTIAARRISLINCTPSAFYPLVEPAGPADYAALRSLRWVFLGGEPIAMQRLRAWAASADCRAHIVNTYGPTECTDVTASYVIARPFDERDAPVPIGRPVSNTQLLILDRHLALAPLGVAGELCIGGAGVGLGYLNDPALTAERFVPNPFPDFGLPILDFGLDPAFQNPKSKIQNEHPLSAIGYRLYRTGDLARFRPDGAIVYLGRIDGQIKLRGYRIELGEIERTLEQHPGVRAAVALLREDAPGDQRLVAYVIQESGGGGQRSNDSASEILTPDTQALIPALREWLAARLPSSMIPAAFMLMDALPLTPNGKIDRKALPAPDYRADAPASVAPRSAEEEVLAGIWAEVLRVDRVGIHDNFFDLGGHSLLGAQVVAQVRQIFAVELPLRALFEAPTVAQLAVRITAARRAPGDDVPPLVAIQRNGPLPLSFAQQRLWLLDQLEPDVDTYHLPTAVRLRGALDLRRLRSALDGLVARHEALRTTFVRVDGQPMQQVAPRLTLGLRLLDLAGMGAQVASPLIAHLSADVARRPFDLARGPLLRVALLRLAPAEHILLLTLHHIVADAWSLALCVRDLTALYRADGAPAALPDLPIQYADYAVWQAERLASPPLRAQRADWAAQLAGAPPLLDLPTDHPRPPVRGARAGQAAIRLDPTLSAGLAALSRQQTATPFMTLLAAFSLLLARWSGQAEVVVGAPIAGRTHAETQELVGCFLNTLALRCDLAGNPSFHALLARVRAVCLRAYAHQEVPFEQLLEDLQPTRDLSHTPIFQVFLNMLNVPAAPVALPDLTIAPLAPPELGAKFDLTLYVSELADQIGFDLVYDADLFSAARMAELLAQLELALGQVVADPELPIGQITLVTPAAQALLPDPQLPLDIAWHGTIHAALSRQAAHQPDQTALIDAHGCWSYAELEARSNQLAHALIERGVGPQSVAAIYADRSAALVWALIGALKAGSAFLLLDPAYPDARLIDYLDLARPSVWIALDGAGAPPAIDAALARLGVAQRLRLPADPVAAAALLAGAPTHAPRVAIGPDDLAVVGFTSGSTGRPKGILGRHGPLTHFLPWQCRTFDLRADDRFSMLSGLAHDPLQRDVFTALWLGATLTIPTQATLETPARLVAWLRAQAATVVHLTPALGQVLAEGAADLLDALPALRYAFIVGDVLTRRDVARLRRAAPAATCVNLYGSTETQRAVGYYLVAEEAADATALRSQEVLPLGQGMAGAQLLVLDVNGRLAGIGEVGAIHLRSPHLARGYLDDPALTAERFIPNPFGTMNDEERTMNGPESSFIVHRSSFGTRLYSTGDLGRYRPDGAVVFAGRADRQVKLRGFRIELGEIEATLGRHKAVREAVVLAREGATPASGRPDVRLVAYVVTSNELEVTSSADATKGEGRRTKDESPDSSLVTRYSSLGSDSSLAGELRAWLRARLPDYMLPAAFVLLDALPLTPNRKVDRAALPDPDQDADEQAYADPRTPDEELLAGIWATVLGGAQVGIHDNFFELGGHSLLAAQVVARVREVFAAELPLRALFEAPTVADLAARIAQAQRAADPLRIPPLTAQARPVHIPLSFAQQRLWFLHQLDSASPAYHLPYALRLTGAIDLAALARTFAGVVARHETLRTTFQLHDNVPTQQIALPALMAIPLIDLRALPEARRASAAHALAQVQALAPFDLTRGPLLRIGLVRLDKIEHLLMLTLHHIIADGWSIGVLVREVVARYAAAQAGREPALPDLSVQYADYALWQRGWLRGELLEAQFAYWRARLADPPLLDLPIDYPSPPIRSAAGASLPVAAPRALTDALMALSRRAGSTLFMTVLAAFQVLLSRISGQDDILVGAPIAGRRAAATEDLIGFFVNTLVLRADLSGNPPFLKLLAQTRQIALDAYAHQDLPFEQLVEALQPQRSLTQTPLFRVMFALQNVPAASLALPGLRISAEPADTTMAPFDLNLALSETPDGLQGALIYSTALFQPATIARLLEQFSTLLASIAVAPERSIGDLALLSAAQQDQLLAGWRGVRLALPAAAGVHELFAAQAAAIPDAVALAFGGAATNDRHSQNGRWADSGSHAITFGELERRANQLAHRLRRLGMRPEVRVGVCLERQADLVVALLAVLKAGAAYLPLDPDYPAERIAFMLEDSGAAAVIVATKGGEEPTANGERAPAFLGRRAAFAGIQVVDLGSDRATIAEEPTAPPLAAATTSTLAYVIYTSGSTGRPKGVMIEHGQLVNTLHATQASFRFTAQERVPAIASCAFDIALFELLAPMLAGGTTVLLTKQEALDLPRFVAILREITFIHALPALMRAIVDFVRETGLQADYRRLRGVFMGGDLIPIELVRDVQNVFAVRDLYLGYGPTESAITCANYKVQVELPVNRHIIGRPLGNMQVQLYDAHRNPAPIGVAGELYIGGACVGRGYLNRPDLTAERFVPNPFAQESEVRSQESEDERRTTNDEGADSIQHPTSNIQKGFRLSAIGYRLYKTGDLARSLADGTLEFLGRTDEQVKVRGFRIELGEIAAALERHPAVRAAVALAREDRPGDRRLVAYVVTSDELQVTSNEQSAPSAHPSLANELRAFLGEQLPEYMAPSAFVLLDALPLTRNGKIDRKALPAPDQDVDELTYAEPRTPEEELLAGIWATVLGRAQVGIHDNFFELGGHSLLATQLIARVRQAFAVELPLRALFEAPTVAGLAVRISQTHHDTASQPPLRPQPRGATAPLSFAQQRLWFLHQLDPTSPAYHLSYALHLSGALNLAALTHTFSAIVARHETLRTTFGLHEGAPIQQIAPPAPAALPLLDLQWLPADAHSSAMRTLAAAAARKPFDLACGPLLRLAVLRLAPNEHALLLTMHHIVADGWSIGVLVREVAVDYAARCAGQAIRLPELPVQYADYAIWQRDWLQGEALEAHLAYWAAALADAPPLLALPTDRPRPPAQTFNGAQQPLSLSPALLAALHALSRQTGATLFMTLLAAFQALLSRYSGQHDLVVGTPIAGRTQVVTEPLIGFFVNTLALRANLSGAPSFRALLEQVRARTLAAYTHQDIPFEMLVSRLQIARDPRYNPIFQALFVLQNAPLGVLELPSLTLAPVEQSSASSKFDLTLALSETSQGLVGWIAYNTDLFDATTIQRLSGQLTTFLQQVVIAPERLVCDLPLLSAAERQQLLIEWNDAPAGVRGQASELRSQEAILHVLIAAQATQMPDAVALVCGGAHLSYGALDQRATQLARRLCARGVVPGSRVGICVTRSLELLVALLGALKAGAAYVPLDPAYPPARLARMLENSRATLLITAVDDGRTADADAPPRLEPSFCVPTLDLAHDWPLIKRASAAPLCDPIPPDALLYVIATSGSTGVPKSAGVTQRGFLNLLRWFIDSFTITSDERVLIVSSFSFDLTQKDLFAPLLVGGQLHLFAAAHHDPALLRHTIAARRISLINCTPSAFYPLVELNSAASYAALRSLRWALLGGEPIAAQRLHAWASSADCRAHIVNTYGPTECTDVVASYLVAPMADGGSAPVPIGRPVTNAQLYVLNAQMQPAPLGAVGELCIGGAGVGLGYLNDPALTAERFVPNPFPDFGLPILDFGLDPAFQNPKSKIQNEHPLSAIGYRLYKTGDLARFRPDGAIVYLGRIDGQIKLRGYRIELGEIERALEQHAEVRAAVALLRDERLVAYIVTSNERPDAGADLSLVTRHSSLVAELRSGLAARLPEYMLPSAFVVLDALPLTPNGKLDRKALPAPDDDRSDLASYYALPRTALERQLVDLWETVLARAPIGIHDDFFALGGDSIHAAILANRLQQMLDALVFVVAIFDAPSVAALADYLEQRYPAAVARLTGADPLPADADTDSAALAIDEELVATMQRVIDAPLPPELAPLAHKNPPAAFILSAPRSGSTLLRVMLAGHPRLFAPPELALLSYATLAERRDAFAGRDQGWLEGLLRAVMEIRRCDLEQARQMVGAAEQRGQSVPSLYRDLQGRLGEQLLVDKTTTYAASLHTLRRAEAIFDQPRYIHLVRRPSAMIQSYLDSQIDAVFGHGLPFSARVKAELFWLISQRNVQTFFETIPPERRRQVRFEDLVTRPREVIGELCEFLGLAFEPAMLEPYQGVRMTDGALPESRMVGDPRFHQHREIEAAMAWKWAAMPPDDALSLPTVTMARSLGYTIADAPSAALERLDPRGERMTPLSFAQERLWFLDQLLPGQALYTMPFALRLSGALELRALAGAFRAIIARHSVLRTTFPSIDGVPAQVIVPTGSLALPFLDVMALPPERREPVAQMAGRSAAHTPFDLARGPLLRLTLLRLAPDEHVLLMMMHHIVADGWSLGVLVREIGALYPALRAGQAARLPELPIQYADYAFWQRQWLRGELLERQFAYWRDQLANLPRLNLPLDYPPPPVRKGGGASLPIRIPASVGEALAALSRRASATLFMTLLAAFEALLARYSGQEDFGVGTPAAGRTRAEIEPLIGFFVNTLVVRARLSGNPTFEALLSRVRQQALDAYAHQELPFELLVEALSPERSLGQTPLFQVMFALQNTPQQALNLPGLRLRSLLLGRESALFDLTLALEQTEAGLQGSLEYATELFEAATIARLLGNFQTLLASIAAHPAQRLSDLPLLSLAERQQMLVEWNDIVEEIRRQEAGGRSLASNSELLPPASSCVHELFTAQVARTPNAIACVTMNDEDRPMNQSGGSFIVHISYAELERRSNQFAHHLRRLGVGPEALAGIYATRSIELVIALLGVLKAGGAYVPLDPSYPAERLSFMLADARARVLITMNDQRRTANDGRSEPENGRKGDKEIEMSPYSSSPLLPFSTNMVDLHADWPIIARQPTEGPPSQVNADNPAYVIYTSGSTGRPKGVVVSHRALVAHNRAIIGAFDLRPSDRALQFASISFDLAVEELFPTWAAGSTVVLWPDRAAATPDEFVAFVDRQRLTVVNLPTSYWQAWVGALASTPGPARLPTALRLVVVGSEKALSDRLALWSDRVGGQARWLNGYGVTEATISASFYESPQEHSAHTAAYVPLGRPLAHLRAYLLDRHLNPVPIGVPGELHVAGIGLARGYLGRPDLTAERFVPNPFVQRSGIWGLGSGAGSQEAEDEGRRTKNKGADSIQNPNAQRAPEIQNGLPLSAIGYRLYKTGDLVRYRADGTLEFVGRSDDQVKLRGFRIELGEIEAALGRHPAVGAAAVLVREDAPGAARLVAYVVLTDAERQMMNDEPESFVLHPSSFVQELRAFLAERLPSYMLPVAFVALDTLPLTPNGKVDRKALPALDPHSDPALSIAPRDDLEALLARIWAELLGCEAIGIHENFFALGGHSLLAVRLMERVRQATGAYLDLASLFQYATIAAQAMLLRERQGALGWRPLVPIQPLGRSRSLFLVHPASGSVLCYRALAEALGQDQPVYGLQARGVDDDSAPLDSIMTMATAYVVAMRAIQPSGPYRVAGWSFGGVVAFEIARQLVAQGEAVEQLALLDTQAPPVCDEATDALSPLAAFVSAIAGQLGLDTPAELDLPGEDIDEQLATLLARGQAIGLLDGDVTLEQMRRRYQIFTAHERALTSYRPAAYTGSLTVLRARERREGGVLRDSSLGWEAALERSVTVIEVPGDHQTLLETPHVIMLADYLRV